MIQTKRILAIPVVFLLALVGCRSTATLTPTAPVTVEPAAVVDPESPTPVMPTKTRIPRTIFVRPTLPPGTTTPTPSQATPTAPAIALSPTIPFTQPPATTALVQPTNVQFTATNTAAQQNTPTVTSTPTATQSFSPPIVLAPALTYLDMTGEQSGWALTDRLVLRTTDGGNNWLNVTPGEGFPAGSMIEGFFLDASKAWILLPGQNLTNGTLYITEEGGRTWQARAVDSGGGALSFIDANNGWMMASRGTSGGSEGIDLYRTNDSGATWSLIHTSSAGNAAGSIPESGTKNGLTFHTQTQGWITGSSSQVGLAWVYTTKDGGQSWQQQDLPIPTSLISSTITVFPPVFFSAQQGVLPVSFLTGANAKVFFTTQDGGSTWNATTPIYNNGLIDCATVLDCYVWNGTSMSYTRDGGASWSNLTTNVNLRNNLLQFDFISANTGWAISLESDGQVGIYQSVDGGANWIMLGP